MNKKTKLIIVAGKKHCCKSRSLYQILEDAAKIDCDEIILMDNNSYILANFEINILIKEVSSKDFKPEKNVNYLLLLEMDNTEGIVRTTTKLAQNKEFTFKPGYIIEGKFITKKL